MAVMAFYESISAWYDHIFPVDPQAVRFLAAHARPGCRLLDLACGTGGHAAALARLGHPVTGVDLDEAMIRRARARAAEASGAGAAAGPAGAGAGAGGLDFRVLDMREAGRRLEPGFGLVYCIGNSLVHLESERAIGAVLADCLRLLEPGGRLVVQILNYDRLLARRLTELPTLVCEEPPLRFVRRYDYSPGERVVAFRTELTVREPEGERTMANTVPLWILEREPLERLARAAGFRDLEVFGGFGGEPLGSDSLPLILCAQRGL
jgi:SAM-dependent methyltransferase